MKLTLIAFLLSTAALADTTWIDSGTILSVRSVHGHTVIEWRVESSATPITETIWFIGKEPLEVGQHVRLERAFYGDHDGRQPENCIARKAGEEPCGFFKLVGVERVK